MRIEQSASINAKSDEEIAKENEERKKRKRERNREYQRAWRQRNKVLKEKYWTEEKEEEKRKRHREIQRAYYHRTKALKENDKNVEELFQKKLEDLQMASQKLENVQLEQNQHLTQQLRIYEESHKCITPKVILHRTTDIPGDGNCLFHSLIRVLQLQISTCDLRIQLRDSPYLNSCHNPQEVYNILSSNNEYGDLDCLYLFAKNYNQNICVHYHYFNVISKNEDTRFCHFKANDTHNWIHLDLRELHFTPYFSDDEKMKENERKQKQKNREYSKRYRDKKRTLNLQTGPFVSGVNPEYNFSSMSLNSNVSGDGDDDDDDGISIAGINRQTKVDAKNETNVKNATNAFWYVPITNWTGVTSEITKKMDEDKIYNFGTQPKKRVPDVLQRNFTVTPSIHNFSNANKEKNNGEQCSSMDKTEKTETHEKILNIAEIKDENLAIDLGDGLVAQKTQENETTKNVAKTNYFSNAKKEETIGEKCLKNETHEKNLDVVVIDFDNSVVAQKTQENDITLNISKTNDVNNANKEENNGKKSSTMNNPEKTETHEKNLDKFEIKAESMTVKFDSCLVEPNTHENETLMNVTNTNYYRTRLPLKVSVNTLKYWKKKLTSIPSNLKIEFTKLDTEAKELLREKFLDMLELEGLKVFALKDAFIFFKDEKAKDRIKEVFAEWFVGFIERNKEVYGVDKKGFIKKISCLRPEDQDLDEDDANEEYIKHIGNSESSLEVHTMEINKNATELLCQGLSCKTTAHILSMEPSVIEHWKKYASTYHEELDLLTQLEDGIEVEQTLKNVRWRLHNDKMFISVPDYVNGLLMFHYYYLLPQPGERRVTVDLIKLWIRLFATVRVPPTSRTDAAVRVATKKFLAIRKPMTSKAIRRLAYSVTIKYQNFSEKSSAVLESWEKANCALAEWLVGFIRRSPRFSVWRDQILHEGFFVETKTVTQILGTNKNDEINIENIIQRRTEATVPDSWSPDDVYTNIMELLATGLTPEDVIALLNQPPDVVEHFVQDINFKLHWHDDIELGEYVKRHHWMDDSQILKAATKVSKARKTAVASLKHALAWVRCFRERHNIIHDNTQKRPEEDTNEQEKKSEEDKSAYSMKTFMEACSRYPSLFRYKTSPKTRYNALVGVAHKLSSTESSNKILEKLRGYLMAIKNRIHKIIHYLENDPNKVDEQLVLKQLPHWLRRIVKEHNLVQPVIESCTREKQCFYDRSSNEKRALTAAAHAYLSKSNKVELLSRALAFQLHVDTGSVKRAWILLRNIATQKLYAHIESGDPPGTVFKEDKLNECDWLVADLLLLYTNQIELIPKNGRFPINQESAYATVFDLVCKHQLEDETTDGQSSGSWYDALEDYNKRGFFASVVLLQRRWYELKKLTKISMLEYWRNRQEDNTRPPPHHLCRRVATRFQKVVVQPLPSWEFLVRLGKITYDKVAYSEQDEDIAGDKDSVVSETVTRSDLESEEDDLILVEKDVETIDVESFDDNSGDLLIDETNVKIEKNTQDESPNTSFVDKETDQHTNAKGESASKINENKQSYMEIDDNEVRQDTLSHLKSDSAQNIKSLESQKETESEDTLNQILDNLHRNNFAKSCNVNNEALQIETTKAAENLLSVLQEIDTENVTTTVIYESNSDSDNELRIDENPPNWDIHVTSGMNLEVAPLHKSVKTPNKDNIEKKCSEDAIAEEKLRNMFKICRTANNTTTLEITPFSNCHAIAVDSGTTFKEKYGFNSERSTNDTQSLLKEIIYKVKDSSDDESVKSPLKRRCSLESAQKCNIKSIKMKNSTIKRRNSLGKSQDYWNDDSEETPLMDVKLTMDTFVKIEKIDETRPWKLFSNENRIDVSFLRIRRRKIDCGNSKQIINAMQRRYRELSIRKQHKYSWEDMSHNPDFNIRLKRISSKLINKPGFLELMYKCKAITVDVESLPCKVLKKYQKRQFNDELSSDCTDASPAKRMRKDSDSRTVKKVSLPDIEQVRRLNRSILTAQVAPITQKTDPSDGEQFLNTAQEDNIEEPNDEIMDVDVHFLSDEDSRMIMMSNDNNLVIDDESKDTLTGIEENNLYERTVAVDEDLDSSSPVPSILDLERLLHEIEDVPDKPQHPEESYCCLARAAREMKRMRMHKHARSSCTCCCSHLMRAFQNSHKRRQQRRLLSALTNLRARRKNLPLFGCDSDVEDDDDSSDEDFQVDDEEQTQPKSKKTFKSKLKSVGNKDKDSSRSQNTSLESWFQEKEKAATAYGFKPQRRFSEKHIEDITKGDYQKARINQPSACDPITSLPDGSAVLNQKSTNNEVVKADTADMSKSTSKETGIELENKNKLLVDALNQTPKPLNASKTLQLEPKACKLKETITVFSAPSKEKSRNKDNNISQHTNQSAGFDPHDEDYLAWIKERCLAGMLAVKYGLANTKETNNLNLKIIKQKCIQDENVNEEEKSNGEKQKTAKEEIIPNFTKTASESDYLKEIETVTVDSDSSDSVSNSKNQNKCKPTSNISNKQMQNNFTISHPSATVSENKSGTNKITSPVISVNSETSANNVTTSTLAMQSKCNDQPSSNRSNIPTLQATSTTQPTQTTQSVQNDLNVSQTIDFASGNNSGIVANTMSVNDVVTSVNQPTIMSNTIQPQVFGETAMVVNDINTLINQNVVLATVIPPSVLSQFTLPVTSVIQTPISSNVVQNEYNGQPTISAGNLTASLNSLGVSQSNSKVVIRPNAPPVIANFIQSQTNQPTSPTDCINSPPAYNLHKDHDYTRPHVTIKTPPWLTQNKQASEQSNVFSLNTRTSILSQIAGAKESALCRENNNMRLCINYPSGANMLIPLVNKNANEATIEIEKYNKQTNSFIAKNIESENIVQNKQSDCDVVQNLQCSNIFKENTENNHDTEKCVEESNAGEDCEKDTNANFQMPIITGVVSLAAEEDVNKMYTEKKNQHNIVLIPQDQSKLNFDKVQKVCVTGENLGLKLQSTSAIENTSSETDISENTSNFETNSVAVSQISSEENETGESVWSLSTQPPVNAKDLIIPETNTFMIICADATLPLLYYDNHNLIVTDKDIECKQPVYFTMAPKNAVCSISFEEDEVITNVDKPAVESKASTDQQEQVPRIKVKSFASCLTQFRPKPHPDTICSFNKIYRKITDSPLVYAQIMKVVSKVEIIRTLVLSGSPIYCYNTQTGSISPIIRATANNSKPAFGLHCTNMLVARQLVKDLNNHAQKKPVSIYHCKIKSLALHEKLEGTKSVPHSNPSSSNTMNSQSEINRPKIKYEKITKFSDIYEKHKKAKSLLKIPNTLLKTLDVSKMKTSNNENKKRELLSRLMKPGPTGSKPNVGQEYTFIIDSDSD